MLSAIILGTFIFFLLCSPPCVPVGERLELWKISASEGWSLEVPHRAYRGLSEKTLADHVVGIARSEGGFLVRVQDADGEIEMRIVSREGQSWDIQTIQSSRVDLGAMHFRTPSVLRQQLILKDFWWIFVLEIMLCICGFCGFVAARRILRRRRQIHIVRTHVRIT